VPRAHIAAIVPTTRPTLLLPSNIRSRASWHKGCVDADERGPIVKRFKIPGIALTLRPNAQETAPLENNACAIFALSEVSKWMRILDLTREAASEATG